MKTAEEWAFDMGSFRGDNCENISMRDRVAAIQSDARKDLEQELQRLRSDISTTESALGISGIYAKLEQERDQLRQELQAAKCAPPKSFLSAPDSIIMKCGHNSYWKTHYENCMACRAEKAEQQVEAQSNLVCNIQDTCRSRGFMQRPVDEAVIALAQERDTLQHGNAELAAQVARLREAIERRKSFGRQLEGSDASRAAQEAIYEAISLPPSDALKPILEFVKRARGISAADFDKGSNFQNQANAILKQYGHE